MRRVCDSRISTSALIVSWLAGGLAGCSRAHGANASTPDTSRDAAAQVVDASGGCPTATASNGVYHASYIPISGTCGPIANPFEVVFNSLDATVQTRPNARLSTEVAVQGCMVHLVQQIESPSGVTRIEGLQLVFKNNHELSGTVMITMLDAMGQASCQGTYEADLVKSMQ